MPISWKLKLIPKKLGGVVDALYTTRQKRLVDQTVIKDMSTYETRLKDHLIAELPKSDASGVSGKLARATVTTKPVPTVKDWDKLYAYVKEHDAWELLQRRLNDTAVVERWERGEEIPGIDSFNVVNVSITKI
jgi:hypothetical protein